MRLSELFTKTKREAPAGEEAQNARLLTRAGFIYKDSAGVYALLPLGLRVIEKIKAIVREEMNQLGGQELLMTTLQRKEVWARTNRWDDKQVDVWFKSVLKNGTEVGMGWSHEEPISLMLKEFVASYRDLPVYVYQFQTKLRNELRAKSGLLRGREFIMKDLYSFARTDKEHQQFYDGVTKAYLKVFERLGIGDKTFVTFASGEPFTQFSHEFQTLTTAGEDTIYLDKKRKLAVNAEVMNTKVLGQLGLKQSDLVEHKAAEVGNIFSFGTTKSKQLGLTFTDEKGKEQLMVLGSYGIGITRLMGVIVECFADGKGMIWPGPVAPAEAHLIALGDDKKVHAAADKLYQELAVAGIEVLYDDRTIGAGEKFADADLIGVPMRIVVSDKTLKVNSAELKARTELAGKLVKLSQVTQSLKGN